MKMTHIKKRRNLYESVFLSLLTIVMVGCGGNHGGDEPVEKKDCYSAYDEICDNIYSSPQDALNDCDEFLNDYDSECAYWDEVQEIKEEFQNMKTELSSYKSDLPSFIESVSENSEFLNSSHSVVANSWNKCFENEKANRFRNVLNNLSFEDFEWHMKDDALQRVKDDFSSGGPFGMVPTGYVESVEHSGLVPIGGESAKQCEAVFRVHMEGAMGLGLRSGTIKIKIIGQLGLTEDGRLQYHPKDYSVLETTGAC